MPKIDSTSTAGKPNGHAGNQPAPAPAVPAVEPQPVKSPGGTREAALRVLDGAARHGFTSNDTVEKIVHISGSSDWSLRRAAIPALAQISGPDGYGTLIRLLDDPNATIQAEAAQALGGLGVREAIDPLKTLLSHEQPEVALQAAMGLGRLSDQSGLPVAIRFLRKDNPHTRLAVRVFGAIVGQRFRATPEGIAAARRHLKNGKKKWKWL